jgi:hypothetical protein
MEVAGGESALGNEYGMGPGVWGVAGYWEYLLLRRSSKRNEVRCVMKL